MDTDSRHPGEGPVVAMDALHACIGNDPGRVCKILRLLRQSIPTEMARLQAAALARDVATAHRSAHSIKSNAALLGAVRLRTKACELEDYGRATDVDSMLRELGGLQALVEEVVLALGAQLARLSGERSPEQAH